MSAINMKSTAFPLSLLALAGSVLGGSYSRSDSVVGEAFNTFFDYQNIPDPTHGFTTYVDQETAQSKNLTSFTQDSFVLRADSTSKLDPSGTGRNTIRLNSKKQLTTHVAVFNMRHIPEGCGTWPAVWEVGANWPNQGEFDIVEGVNNGDTNQATLHTAPGCTIPQSIPQMSGKIIGTDCDATVKDNSGCGVQVTKQGSYGSPFNNAGGGIYAVERTTTFFKVWFWLKGDPVMPQDAATGASSVDTDKWGTPAVYFPNTSCDFTKEFGPNSITINIALCGDWAGSVFNSMGCGSGTCAAFVAGNPQAMEKAYFDFESINIYEPGAATHLKRKKKARTIGH